MERAAVESQSSSAGAPDLGGSVIRGAAWNVVGTLVKQGLTIGATIVVARLLSPGDYAIAGLATSIMGLFVALTGQGFAQALVQRKELSEIICHSVFWPMVIGGMALTGLMIVLAPWVARFYNQPALIPVIWMLSVGLAIGMIGAVPNALLQRAMRFREINIIGMISGLVSAGLGIGVAILGFGYWALIAPVAGSMVAVAIGAFGLSGYRPRLVLSWHEFKTTMAFGLSLLGSNLLRYFDDYGDRLVLGRFWAAEAFGYYHFALDRSRQPFSLIMGQISIVIFPAFSTIQHDPTRLRRALILGTHRFCLIVFPLYILLIGLADPLLPWLFGPQWRPAIPVFQIFAAYSFMRAFAALVPGTYLAIGLPQADLVFNIFRAVFTLPALVYLGIRNVDIMTASAMLVAIWLIQTPFYIGYLFRKINIGLRDMLGTFRSLLGATILMFTVLTLIRAVGDMVGCFQWFTVVCSATISSGLFLLVLRHQFVDVIQQVRRAVKVNENHLRQRS